MNHTHNISRAKVAALLREHGILPTQQRVLIGKCLLGRARHLSADQVREQVRRCGLEISKATIYNTLGLFARKGLIREVIVDPTRVFYDSNTEAHHHFYNIDTGVLTDIDEHEIALNELPQLPSGTVAAGVDVVIRIRSRV